ncbi:hypothetical protein X963_4334 [Burkholderia pseudomallei MSHR7498]|nr:hypothetical protein DO71_4633 [Burkholderia pseudomallei]KGS01421.1 hypothetical protein X948_3127 [Burkholderia pseudomallei MSHR5608]KGS76070.1 hypothetical protein X942_5125 [Burkholderia pseudomallei MSHR5596]KGS93735.1 hypothetical protein X963_4334 [Burkholderia pseudomallei MSHR7498]KGX53993.1 hypothetical protein Y025_4504 [Burkholderia pseudomallei TSV32]KGX97697.1 hypothetical protein Y023_4578 [Burkholderia pseudomallei A79D]KGX98620.1 hypothetical protein X997_4340 [Burkholder
MLATEIDLTQKLGDEEGNEPRSGQRPKGPHGGGPGKMVATTSDSEEKAAGGHGRPEFCESGDRSVADATEGPAVLLRHEGKRSSDRRRPERYQGVHSLSEGKS